MNSTFFPSEIVAFAPHLTAQRYRWLETLNEVALFDLGKARISEETIEVICLLANTLAEHSLFFSYPLEGAFRSRKWIIQGVKNTNSIVSASLQLAHKLTDLSGRFFFLPKFYEEDAFFYFTLSLDNIFRVDFKKTGNSFSNFSYMVSSQFWEDTFSCLTTPGGILLEKERLFEHPLFFHLKEEEKKELFGALTVFLYDPLFPEKYERFLLDLRSDRWSLSYVNEPRELASLSLIAFFDEQITEEEFFILQTAAEAFREASLVRTPQFAGVASVSVKVLPLDREFIADYLCKAGFPPFSENAPCYLVTNRKSLEQLEGEKERLLEEFMNGSSLERTFLEYELSTLLHHTVYLPSVEKSIFFDIHSKVGFGGCESENIFKKCILPPPKFAIEMFRSASIFPSKSPSDHVYTLGFSEDDTPFYSGVRVISIPSVFSSIPRPHSFKKGPASLGMFFHDINYHMPLEVNNPYIPLLIELAKRLQQVGKFEHSNKKLRDALIDREATYFREMDPVPAFFAYLRRQIRASFNLCEFSYNEAWVKECIYPHLIEIVVGTDLESSIPSPGFFIDV